MTNKEKQDVTDKKTRSSKKNKKDKIPLTPEQKKLRRQRIIAWVLIVICSIGLTGVLGVGALTLKNIKNAPEVKREDFLHTNSTVILDNKQNQIYDTAEKRSDPVSYDQIPQSLVDAFVSVEDSRFFVHGGFDVPRFTKAALSNLFDSLRHGSVSFGQGGSTLTMQLIKNKYFMENENAATGVNRKLQEIYLSTKIEREEILSKKMIFELYINMINYGVPQTMGAEASAQAYFGKSLKDINLVESAFLAGVINAPNVNSPYASIEEANDRTKEVLYLMNYHGYITDEEYQLAKTVKIEDLLVDSAEAKGEAFANQAYVDVVLKEAERLTGLDPFKTPMIIHTSMDSGVQAGIDKFQRREAGSHLDADAVYRSSPEYDADGKIKLSEIQVGSTIINNKTGEIIGIVGGYDYNGALLLNRASNPNSSPASIMKPIIDYAPAFEYQGLATSHVFLDQPMYYKGTNVLIGNYDGRYKGQVKLMEAVADSRNIPALEALQGTIDTIGEAKTVDYLHNLGFKHFDDDKFSLGFGIGSGDFLTTPIELAGASTVMFNGGNYIEPHTIRRIEYQDAKREPYEPTHKPVPVISDSAAWLTTQTMKYAVESSFNEVIAPTRRSGYTVYGKTGTNRYGDEYSQVGVPRDSMKDRLMLTATSEYSIATWTGFDKKTSDSYLSDGDADRNLTGQLNSYLLTLIDENVQPSNNALPRPSGVAEINHIIGTFPYQSPIDGMDPSLIATGYIKQEFLKLAEPSPQELKSLSTHSVSMSQSGAYLNFNIEMTPYPDASQLVVADATMPLKYPDGSVYGSGIRLYDPSWLFGAVRYKSEVRVDGNSVQETMTDSPSQKLSIPFNSSSGKIEVCSYYTFDKSPGKKSNIVCSPVDSTTISISGPAKGSDISDVAAWLNNYGIDYAENWSTSVNGNYGNVVQSNPDILGKNVKPQDLKGSVVSLTIKDVQISVGDRYDSFSNANSLKKLEDRGKVNVVTSGSGSIIKSITINGTSVNSFNVHPNEGNTVYIELGN